MVVTQEFYIGFRDINKDLTIKNSTLLANFVDIAGIHSSKIGDVFGSSPIRWLLTGYKVKIYKRPRHGEKIYISTWATEIRNIKSNREFEVRSKDGELLIVALSSWVSYNIETKRPERVGQELIDAYGVEPDRSNFTNEEIIRVDEPQNVISKHNIVVDWKYIDLNDHLNNSYYMDIAEHCLTDSDLCDFLNNYSSFEIVFKKEIKEGTIVSVEIENLNDKINVWFVELESGQVHSKIVFNK